MSRLFASMLGLARLDFNCFTAAAIDVVTASSFFCSLAANTIAVAAPPPDCCLAAVAIAVTRAPLFRFAAVAVTTTCKRSSSRLICGLLAMLVLLSRLAIAVRTRRRRDRRLIGLRGRLDIWRRLHSGWCRRWCRGTAWRLFTSSLAFDLGAEQGLILDE